MIAKARNVNITDRMWARLMSSTNQPNFAHYDKAIQQKREQNAFEGTEVTSKEPDEVIETGNRQGLPKDLTETSSESLTRSEPEDSTV